MPREEPASRVILPVFSVPGLLPGAINPPFLTVTAPTVPEPASVPALFTVVVLVEILPLITNFPASMVVAPV